jgi:hypothetical protein
MDTYLWKWSLLIVISDSLRETKRKASDHIQIKLKPYYYILVFGNSNREECLTMLGMRV